MNIVRVKRPTHHQCLALSALHGSAFAQPWGAASIGILIDTPGTFAFVAGGQTQPVGFLIARVAADESEILTLAVSPGARRQGHGAGLVRSAAVHAQILGARAMFLEVETTNAAARKLYEALGFSCVSVSAARAITPMRGAKPEDALVLRSNLPLSPLGKSAPAG